LILRCNEEVAKADYSASRLYIKSGMRRSPNGRKSGSKTAALRNERRSAAEIRDEPEEKGQRDAEEQAGDDGKVERGVFAAVDDVAGQFPKAKGELVPEVKKNTNQNEECSKEDKRTAEFAERFHRRILLEAVN
jgi:hypothetical protein